MSVGVVEGGHHHRKRSASPDGGGLVSPSNHPENAEPDGCDGARTGRRGGGVGASEPLPPTLKLGGTSSTSAAAAVGGGASAKQQQRRDASRQHQQASRSQQQEGPAKRPFKVRRKEDDLGSYGRALEGCSTVNEYLVESDLGVGTFGVVTKATRRDGAGTKVAMKRIIVHNETDGVPITTIREIKLLKALSHENIVPLYDMVFQEGNAHTRRGTILMIFPYMDHDLSGLLDNERVVWTAPMIKLYAKQLLKGTAYLHRNNLIHRDLKSANILVDNTGLLKIADFGLARSILGGLSRANNEIGSPEYTNMVVTRWYRPPELFLRFRKYGTSIDIWGVGCILGEMLTKRPIIQGNTDQEQLQKIWELCGLPTKESFPGWDEHGGCPDDGCEHPEKTRGQLMTPPPHIQSHLNWRRHVRDDFVKMGPPSYADLIDRCLTLDPAKRPTALECLEHEYFQTLPAPAKLGSLQVYGASHEAGRKNNRTGPAPRLLYQGQPVPPVYADWPRSAAGFDHLRQTSEATLVGNSSQAPPPASFNPHLPVPTLHAQAPQTNPTSHHPAMPHGPSQQQAMMASAGTAGGFIQQQGMPPAGYGIIQQQQPYFSGQQQQQAQMAGFNPALTGFRPPPPLMQQVPPPPTMAQPHRSGGPGSRRDRGPVHRAVSTASSGPAGLMLAPKRPPPSFIPGFGDDAANGVGFRPPLPPGHYGQPPPTGPGGSMPFVRPPPPSMGGGGFMGAGRPLGRPPPRP